MKNEAEEETGNEEEPTSGKKHKKEKEHQQNTEDETDEDNNTNTKCDQDNEISSLTTPTKMLKRRKLKKKNGLDRTHEKKHKRCRGLNESSQHSVLDRNLKKNEM